MNIRLKNPRPHGVFNAIPSKAEAHRALICAALSDRETFVFCPVPNDDINATVRVLRELGTKIVVCPDGFRVYPVVPAAKMNADCGESGSTLRFMLPVASALCPDITLLMSGRLAERPLLPLLEQMKIHGVDTSVGNPLRCTGLLSGGEYRIAGGVSSQFFSGLLMALTRLGGSVSAEGRLESRPYIDITIDILKKFGAAVAEKDCFTVKKGVLCSPGRFNVGGDWSDAAFFLTMGVIGTLPVTVSGLSADSAQGDRAIADILCRMGARVVAEESVTAYPSELHGTEIDAAHIPDLVPVLAVAATAAAGETHIYNASRLRLKESDRIRTVCDMINALGGRAAETNDGITVTGTALTGGTVNACGDHRIAMSAAVAAVRCQTTEISGAEAVNKSHPSFWQDFGRLCQ